MSALAKQVLDALLPGIGRRLVAVRYHCYPYEITKEADLHEASIVLDGEVSLVFDPDHELYITWCESKDWKEHFSVSAGRMGYFNENVLRAWPVETTAIWQTCIGTRLTGFAILGWECTPSIIRMTFEKASLLVGIGHENGFGDCDCVLVRPDEDIWLGDSERAEVLWETTT